MNYQKHDITKYVMEQLGLLIDEKLIKKTIPLWWTSNRVKPVGGLKLTEQGYTSLIQAGLKEYTIQFEKPLILTNQVTIWLDHFIDCPFYLTDKNIHVFSERMAVQLLLFAGDVEQFSIAKAKST